MPSPSPQLRIGIEEETPHGWRYHASIDRGRGAGPVSHIILLSWVDHEHWSGGRHPPSRVVEQVVRLVLERAPDLDLPPTFDAATTRRWVPGLDDLVAQRL